jgi:hypothetical protein
MLSTKTSSVRIGAKGARKVVGDTAPVRAGESRIADAHMKALARVSGKAEQALIAALARKP